MHNIQQYCCYPRGGNCGPKGPQSVLENGTQLAAEVTQRVLQTQSRRPFRAEFWPAGNATSNPETSLGARKWKTFRNWSKVRWSVTAFPRTSTISGCSGPIGFAVNPASACCLLLPSQESSPWEKRLSLLPRNQWGRGRPRPR